MGIFDRRKERDKEKSESPEWLQAYMPSFTFLSDKAGNPSGGFSLNAGVSTRLLKKPQDDYEGVDDFKLLLISTTEKKILGTVPYDKALKQLEKYQIDETKEEILLRPLSHAEMRELIEITK